MRTLTLLLLLAGLAVVVQSASVRAAPSAGRVFWASAGPGGEIRSADLNSPAAQHVITATQSTPLRVALDFPRGKIYWSDAPGHKIERANLDGTGVEDVIVTTGIDYPSGLAVDSASGKLYWSQRQSCLFFPPCAIKRANLDGTGEETIAATYAADIEIDPVHGKLYFIGPNSFGIARTNLDGSGGVEQLVSNVDASDGLALDLNGGKLYWVQRHSPPRLLRANLDGTNVEVLPVTVSSPQDIEVDAPARKIYWTDNSSIGQANLDGSAAGTAVPTVDQPTGLELGPAGVVLGGVAELAPPADGATASDSSVGLAVAVGLAAAAAALFVLRRRTA